MQTRVQKWANSLGVRIPRGLAEKVGLGAGSEVSLSAKDGELVVKPSVPARLSLDDLLAEVSEENLHSSIDTGSAVGAEIFCCLLRISLIWVTWSGWSSHRRRVVSRLDGVLL
ncbi:MAG: AbrB/MazE/SpoVT family DNA-binding domain-containing protein [Cyanobacteriota bacterium]